MLTLRTTPAGGDADLDAEAEPLCNEQGAFVDFLFRPLQLRTTLAVGDAELDAEVESLCSNNSSRSVKTKELDAPREPTPEDYFDSFVSRHTSLSQYLDDRPIARQFAQILSIIQRCILATVGPIVMLVLTFGVVYSFVYADAWANAEPVDRRKCRNTGSFKGNYATEKYMTVYFNLGEEIMPIPVDRRKCRNTCFDGRFKGNYATEKYMTMYFNLDEEILPIVWSFLFYSHALSWVTSSAAKLAWKGRLDYVWAVVFLFQLYPNFYNWWVMFNYHNERINWLYAQQMVFVITEFLSSVSVCILANKANNIDSKSESSSRATKPLMPLYMIAFVSLVHIYVGGADEFFHHTKDLTRFTRYWGLTSTDIVPLIAALLYIYRQSESRLQFYKRFGGAMALAAVLVLCMPSQSS